MRSARVALILLTALCGTALCACAHTQTDSPKLPPKELTVMNTSEADVANKLTLNAEEVGKRFLKLIAGLDSREDITPTRIQDVMGFPVSVAPSALGAVVWSTDLGGGWRYAFDYVPESPSLLRGVGLSFEHDTDRFSDMEAICSLDFDHYDSSLKSMGFVASPTYGPIGQLENWRYAKFAKGGSGGDILISIIPQNVVAGSAGKVCVKSISTLNGR
ncbi:hypothetical protein [Xanthomonas hortorum]|uniref:hypothetical protein n=1 Tax=Xanthomonas hortorum TaxID=56454 RepID=UPI001E3327D1|nr:hypothetical protein [Xanthomonas hortorum]MCC8553362.1 hypothetical protein [Xanthomonas hortorum pv. gardneri]MCE4364803.1 hypothetical protein [Xanthomonas hortorum]